MPSAAGCQKLADLIALDDEAASPRAVLYSPSFHSLSFRDSILGLNENFESLAGPVDIDWMLRSAFYGVGALPGGPLWTHGMYFGAKAVWNVASKRSPWSGMSEPGNRNAPLAAAMWLQEGMKLREIFAPALETCGIR